jgi:hypothetical protein
VVLLVAVALALALMESLSWHLLFHVLAMSLPVLRNRGRKQTEKNALCLANSVSEIREFNVWETVLKKFRELRKPELASLPLSLRAPTKRTRATLNQTTTNQQALHTSSQQCRFS